MKMFLISDNVDTQTGMRLAGVEGVVVHEREELYDTLQKHWQEQRDRNYSPYRKVREGIPGHSGGCPPQP